MDTLNKGASLVIDAPAKHALKTVLFENLHFAVSHFEVLSYAFECDNVPHVSVMLNVQRLLIAEDVISAEIYLITMCTKRFNHKGENLFRTISKWVNFITQ